MPIVKSESFGKSRPNLVSTKEGRKQERTVENPFSLGAARWNVKFDADRDEDAVFHDISVAVDNKLFPNKETATDPSDLDPSMMFDAGEVIDTGSDYEDQGDDQLSVFGEDNTGGFVEDLKKCKIIFMMGGPGSGKGTQCEKLAEKYGFTHLSTGELLHQELASESERSRLIRDVMERGDLVPSGLVLELLKEAMVASLGHTKGFLIDGYPREVKQGEEFGRKIGDPHLVICMDCSADTMTSRLLQRSQSSQHGEDTSKTIAKRLEAYHRASIPVVAYYETKTQLRKINAEGAPDEVLLQLCTAIDSIL